MPYADPIKAREAAHIRMRRYRKRHPERVKEASARWYEKHRGASLEKCRRYKLNRSEEKKRIDREANRANAIRWAKANPERRRIQHQNRKALIKGAVGKISAGLVLLLLSEQGGRCAGCWVDLGLTGYHMDHVVPLAKGGRHKDENIQLLCPPCNMAKGTWDLRDFMTRWAA